MLLEFLRELLSQWRSLALKFSDSRSCENCGGTHFDFNGDICSICSADNPEAGREN